MIDGSESAGRKDVVLARTCVILDVLNFASDALSCDCELFGFVLTHFSELYTSALQHLPFFDIPIP